MSKQYVTDLWNFFSYFKMILDLYMFIFWMLNFNPASSTLTSITEGEEKTKPATETIPGP